MLKTSWMGVARDQPNGCNIYAVELELPTAKLRESSPVHQARENTENSTGSTCSTVNESATYAHKAIPGISGPPTAIRPLTAGCTERPVNGALPGERSMDTAYSARGK